MRLARPSYPATERISRSCVLPGLLGHVRIMRACKHAPNKIVQCMRTMRPRIAQLIKKKSCKGERRAFGSFVVMVLASAGCAALLFDQTAVRSQAAITSAGLSLDGLIQRITA